MTSALSFSNENASFQASTINSSVHNSFHLPPRERPQTPPQPAVLTPFPRDADLFSVTAKVRLLPNRQEIPEDVLRLQEDSGSDSDNEHDASQSSASNDDLEDDDYEDDRFKKDLVVLCDFSFISSEIHAKSFEMHALVQLATQRWLAASRRLEWWKQQFISCLCAAFPTTGEYKN
ncbi:hypothetical protein BU25DRAFT_418063 [Macroventuria anomochaeta]|uniref:Uncharacterized protein n=1 Tax=Macroventuria anomochaeta TaxID=301207 RepID=A0ACB6SDI3_9PLEO|nr:uncharacterized protein BU25DRAFT_418063 [Macroventuria anomochaeta]KAF2632370.1 hypothetical protein BU25DRAFT_418063 [Macroventuria anomochaeta]